MSINYIYDTDGTKLGIDPDNKILHVITSSDGYDKKKFSTFLEYLTSFWSLVESGDDKYFILLDLSGATAKMMPMEFYTSLIQTMNGMGKSIEKHLHSMCVLMSNNGLMSGIIKIALKLFDVPRPVKLVTNRNDVQPFFDSNKLDL